MIVRLFAVLILMLALTPPVHADKEDAVSYRTIDLPFLSVSGTGVTGRLGQETVVVYLDANQQLHTAVLPPRDRAQVLPFLQTQDVSAAGLIGTYSPFGLRSDTDTGLRGFLFADGTVHTLHVPRVHPNTPRTILTEAIAGNDAGLIGGDFRRQGEDTFHCFLYDHTARTYEVIDGPGAVSTACLAISPTGRVLVSATDGAGVTRHYVWERGTLTELPAIPDLPKVELVGRTDAGLLAGNAGRAGFVWDGQHLQAIDVPGSLSTDVNGIDVAGRVVWGSYRDSAGVDHGFIATLGGQGRGSQRHSDKLHAAFTPEDCGPGSKRQVCVEARRSQD